MRLDTISYSVDSDIFDTPRGDKVRAGAFEKVKAVTEITAIQSF
ncbi:MAG: hypothetical protein ACI4V4_02310 [Eubacterium sp.]